MFTPPHHASGCFFVCVCVCVCMWVGGWTTSPKRKLLSLPACVPRSLTVVLSPQLNPQNGPASIFVEQGFLHLVNVSQVCCPAEVSLGALSPVSIPPSSRLYFFV